ncbi:MAG: hypothetical protein QNJ40_06055 [Xanthomonadales bacterium]|nr:hypothetical protein [Xanthomonadales bacterium]
MPNIDIPVPEELSELLAAPKCLDVSLPPPKQLSVTLPSGGSLKSLQDMGKSIPTDCSLTFSLMLQISPLLASMDCLLKILKLLKPMSDAITSFPPTPKVIKEVADAVADLVPCFAMLTPAGMIPFVRDILCLILAVLRCLIGQLNTLAEIMGGLTLQLKAAEEAGNKDLAETLKCAQENSLTSLAHLMQGMEPITAIMDLMAPMLSIAGVQAIQMPALGDDTSAEGIQQTTDTLQQVVDTIQGIVDGLGGCPS